MGKDLSWAGKKSYQPYFELPNAKEPVKVSKPLEVSKRSIAQGKVTTWVKNKVSLKGAGFSTALAEVCKEIPEKVSPLRKLKPAEIRAKRHSDKRFEARFRK